METLLHSASTLKHNSGTKNPRESFTSSQRDGSSPGPRSRQENLTFHFQGPYSSGLKATVICITSQQKVNPLASTLHYVKEKDPHLSVDNCPLQNDPTFALKTSLSYWADLFLVLATT